MSNNDFISKSRGKARFKASISSCLLAITLLGGCRADFKHDGGLIAQMEDNVVQAPNRQWQTYRAAFFLMMISSVAESELKDDNSIIAFYYAATAVNDDINNLGGHVYPQKAWYPYNLKWINTKSQADPSKPAGHWYSPDGVIATATAQAQPPGPQKIDGWLYPCANYLSKPVSQSNLGCGNQPGGITLKGDLSNPYRYSNYVGLFEADIPSLNDHLFKAAASAIREDKFLKLIQDASKGGELGGPAGILWGLLKDMVNVFGEVVDSETHLAAAWRAEADNSATLKDQTFPCGPYAPTEASVPGVETWSRECIVPATTENAGAILPSRPKTPRPTDLVPAEAFEPIYASIRKSCMALRAKLHAVDTSAVKTSGASKSAPQVTQDSMDCGTFAFNPNVYRQDYLVTSTYPQDDTKASVEVK